MAHTPSPTYGVPDEGPLPVQPSSPNRQPTRLGVEVPPVSTPRHESEGGPRTADRIAELADTLQELLTSREIQALPVQVLGALRQILRALQTVVEKVEEVSAAPRDDEGEAPQDRLAQLVERKALVGPPIDQQTPPPDSLGRNPLGGFIRRIPE